jgi:hypothetical protein
MRRGYIKTELLHQSGQTRRLPFRQLQHESRKRRRVDYRMLQWAFQPTANQPAVEGIVAVLDQHGALGET